MEQYNFPARITVNRAGSAEAPEGAIIWSAEISSDRLDAYFTHMAESTLRNFAQDASAGVTFLDSHNSRQLGYGQSLAGVFQVDNGVSRTLADFYTVPGINFGSALTYQSTDDFIRALQARLVRDVSVGFYGGDVICDICGNSLYDWRNCSHWPGMEYAVGDKGNETVVATAEIVDARLAEVSAVYDGATPGAMVMRAQQMSEAGLLEPETARRLETKYRIKLPAGARVFAVAKPVLSSVEGPERTNIVDELQQIRAILAELNAAGESVIDQVRWLVDENARLAPLADEGRQYRADIIEAAITEGVRAMGDNFPTETYREMLKNATPEQVKLLRDRWQAQAAVLFSGGRKTVDNEQQPQAQKRERVPAAAFKS